MDFKNILNQLDEINGNDTTASTPIESTLQSTPVASKQTLTESVAVATKSSRPSLKDVFNTLIENDITLEPAKPGAMAIKSGDATIGTAHTPQAANQMKQAIEKGDITMGGEDDEMNESDEDAKNFFCLSDISFLPDFLASSSLSFISSSSPPIDISPLSIACFI